MGCSRGGCNAVGDVVPFKSHSVGGAEFLLGDVAQPASQTSSRTLSRCLNFDTRSLCGRRLSTQAVSGKSVLKNHLSGAGRSLNSQFLLDLELLHALAQRGAGDA